MSWKTFSKSLAKSSIGLVLTDGIPASSEVDEIAASTVSIMPQGLERLLTSDELRDLLAYLSSLKRQ